MLSTTDTITKIANKKLEFWKSLSEDFVLRVPITPENYEKVDSWGITHFASECANVARTFAKDNGYSEVVIGDCVFVDKRKEKYRKDSYILMVIEVKRPTVER